VVLALVLYRFIDGFLGSRLWWFFPEAFTVYGYSLPDWGTAGRVALIAYACLTTGFFEEVIYRGLLLQHLLDRGTRPAVAVLLSLVVFASVHWCGGWGGVLLIFCWGIIPSLYFVHTRNLIPLVIAHAGYDALCFLE